jgi:hypothetical protein
MRSVIARSLERELVPLHGDGTVTETASVGAPIGVYRYDGQAQLLSAQTFSESPAAWRRA